jgi:hypothetical protein
MLRKNVYTLALRETKFCTYCIQCDCIGQSPAWEGNRPSASQEILCLLWYPKAHCHVHKSPSLIPVLSQMFLTHIFIPYYPKIHSNIIVPSTPSSSEWCLHFRFSDRKFLCFSRLSRAFCTVYSLREADLLPHFIPGSLWVICVWQVVLRSRDHVFNLTALKRTRDWNSRQSYDCGLQRPGVTDRYYAMLWNNARWIPGCCE